MINNNPYMVPSKPKFKQSTVNQDGITGSNVSINGNLMFQQGSLTPRHSKKNIIENRPESFHNVSSTTPPPMNYYKLNNVVQKVNQPTRDIPMPQIQEKGTTELNEKILKLTEKLDQHQKILNMLTIQRSKSPSIHLLPQNDNNILLEKQINAIKQSLEKIQQQNSEVSIKASNKIQETRLIEEKIKAAYAQQRPHISQFINERMKEISQIINKNFSQIQKLEQKVKQQQAESSSQKISELVRIQLKEQTQKIYKTNESINKNILQTALQDQHQINQKELEKIMKKFNQLEATLIPHKSFSRSRHKCTAQAIQLTYQQTLQFQVENKSKRKQLQKVTYYIDEQGHLLDNQMHYLLNSDNSKVKLHKSQLNILQIQGVLK